MIIGLDIDGVLRDQTTALREQYLKDYPEHEHLLQPVVSWGVDKYYPIGKAIYKYWFEDRIKETMEDGPIFKGALEFVKQLKKEGHKVVLVTTQPHNKEHHTLFWIQKHKIPYDEFGFFTEKWLVDCDIYLDDGSHNLEALQERGKRAVCFDQPWNQDWQGERVKSYQEFLNLLQ